MRISDWSSDVCSSDLSGAVAHASRQVLCAAAIAAAVQAVADDVGPRPLLPDRPLLPRRGSARRPPAGIHAARRRKDRKSVVSGKSVSVRVDIGGRRIIKKKNYTNNTSSNKTKT